MNSPLDPRKSRSSIGEYPLTGDPRRAGVTLRSVTAAARSAPAHASRPRSRSLLKFCQYLCLLLAVACLGDVAFDYAHAKITQSYQSWRFDRDVMLNRARSLLPAPVRRGGNPAPAPPSLPEGSLVGRMEIPSVGISVMVLEGDDDGILAKAAGHIPASALPGASGNVAIAGHRDTFFRALRQIRKDDEITFTTVQGTYHYQVASLGEVEPQDVQVLKPTDHPTLTLITCYPFNYIGPAPQRFVVRASEIGPAQASALAPTVAEARPALDSSPARRARSSRRHKAIRLMASRATTAPPARPVEASLVSSLPPSASPPALPAPHPVLRAAVMESSALTPARAQAEPDDPPAGTRSASHNKFGRVRGWLQSIPRHLRIDHPDANPAETN